MFTKKIYKAVFLKILNYIMSLNRLISINDIIVKVIENVRCITKFYNKMKIIFKYIIMSCETIKILISLSS